MNKKIVKLFILTILPSMCVFPCHGDGLSTEAIEQAAAKFKQFEYYDPAAGNLLKYNLFIPQGADSGEHLPMIVFIHDGNATGSDSQLVMQQCDGAAVWATSERQAENPCYVLAPQYSVALTGDDYTVSDYMDYTYDLIDQLARDYNVNPDRIYLTGQYEGAMAAWAMNIKYPDLFAASLLVAGGWNPDAVGILKNHHIWIIDSQSDKEISAMCETDVAELERAGAKVLRNVIDSKESKSDVESAIAVAADNTACIKFTLLDDSGAINDATAPDSKSIRGHTCQAVYSIKGFGNWLFEQSK